MRPHFVPPPEPEEPAEGPAAPAPGSGPEFDRLVQQICAEIQADLNELNSPGKRLR